VGDNARAMKRFLVLVFLLAGCATVSVPTEPVHVVLVGTTDVHGWYNGRIDRPRGGGEPVQSGGLQNFASYVKALRAEADGRVVVVDSGDIFQGTFESNFFEGEPVVHAYNAIGYAAAAVGNHEFDFGPVGPDAVATKPGQDPRGALKRNAGLARFPFLSANMTETATGQTPSWARKSTIVTTGGVRIGIIGLSTPDTPITTMIANVRDLTFSDPVQATVAEARSLRSAGVDAIVVIAHMGGRCRDMQDVRDVASCESDHEAMQYLAALPSGTIDVYFGGHTHSQMRQFINGVATVQAMPFTNEFSSVDLYIDPRAKRVVAERTNIRPHTMVCTLVYSGTDRCDTRNATPTSTLVPRTFAGQVIQPDPAVQQILTPYLEQVAAKRNEKVGIQVAAPFTRSYQRESSLGNLIADALREWAGADIAFMNSGGIRANLRAGELVYSDIFEVSPFDNYPATVMMTGDQIRRALEATTTGERGILQVSGLRYTFDEARTGNRLVSVTLDNGEPLDPNKLYKVVMPDFLVAGGDAMAAAMEGTPPDRIQIFQEQPIREALIETLRKRPMPLRPRVEGRITVLNPKPGNTRE
jgi:5'-nucleotidase